MQLQAGTKLQNGKYEILKTLGQGGFGITYEARQVNLERVVAVKEFFMKDCCERDAESSRISVPTQSNQALVDRFKEKFVREAKMIASFDHPHIVRVIDIFDENGTAYYVMENLPGGSLLEKVKKDGPLDDKLAEQYIRQVADALAYIHSRNTVHLDVKPSNILLNGKGEAVLIDFGISKHYDDAGQQTSSTPVGISKGYAPLEQGRDGDVSQFKPSTDIYSLGATLYYLVTGNTPPEASVIYEEGLERPKGLSDRIWSVIEKAMQPRRKDRPQSIPEFLSLFLFPVQDAVESVEERINSTAVFAPIASHSSEETTIRVSTQKEDMGVVAPSIKMDEIEKPEPRGSLVEPGAEWKEEYKTKMRILKVILLVVLSLVSVFLLLFLIARTSYNSGSCHFANFFLDVFGYSWLNFF